MGYETILVARDGGVARLTLNRPDKLNSLTARMHEEMLTALEDLSKDGETRALVVTGAGRAFCAGQDLGEDCVRPAPGKTLDFRSLLKERYNPVILRLRALSIPVVAAVNGVAAGAGVSLALAADIALAARSARFVLAFAKIGLVPDSGATYFLPRLVGRARARGLALLGDSLSAEEAQAWGLIWKCVDDDALMDEARALAQTLARGPTRAYGLIREALDRAESNGLAAQLELEAELQQRAGTTGDYAEGVAAFAEKRAPRFSGR